MHPAYRLDKPGIAPDCGMKLVPVYAAEQKKEASNAPAERKVLYWVVAMNPSHKSDHPVIAPDGMKLVPVYADEEKQTSMPLGTVEINPEKQQLMGVTYGAAEYETATGSIRAAARVTLDETKIAKVQSKLEGWIDKVTVNFTGKLVQKGDPLLTIYSPEALATRSEEHTSELQSPC